MEHCMKHTLKSISCSLVLLGSAALPSMALAQGNMAPPREDSVEQKSLDVLNKQHVLDRENERLLEETQRRIDTERKLKLSEALKEDQTALEQPRQLLARLSQLPDTLKL